MKLCGCDDTADWPWSPSSHYHHLCSPYLGTVELYPCWWGHGLPALLSPQLLVHYPCGEQPTLAAPWQSLTMLRTSSLKTGFCSSGCEGIYSPIIQEISCIGLFLNRAQAMQGTSVSYKLKQIESMPFMRSDEIKPLLGSPKYTYIYSINLFFFPNEHRFEQLTLRKSVGG